MNINLLIRPQAYFIRMRTIAFARIQINCRITKRRLVSLFHKFSARLCLGDARSDLQGKISQRTDRRYAMRDRFTSALR